MKVIQSIGYSFATTLIPLLVVILALLVMYKILPYDSTPYNSRELLSSSILYVFILSLLFTAGLGAPVSRFLANAVYKENYSKIMPCYYSGLLICLVFEAFFSIPLYYQEVKRGGADFSFVIITYLMLIILTIVFYNLTFVSATKRYKDIALFFSMGMGISVIFSFFLQKVVGVVAAIQDSLMIGFLAVALLEFGLILSSFPKGDLSYWDFPLYLQNSKRLFLANLFYSLGLFVHNFIFWTGELGRVTAKVYLNAPVYDLASAVAMYTNIMASVVFVIEIETRFASRYKSYSDAVVSGRWKDILLMKKRMFRMLSDIIMKAVEIQFISAVVIFLICSVLLPRIGFSGLPMSIYPCLAAGYFAVYVMYGQILFLYYFEDDTGALITSIVFLAGTILCSKITMQFLPITWYGMGLLGGAMLGWTYGYFRLKWLEENFDAHIFCTGQVIESRPEKFPESKIYDRKSGGLRDHPVKGN